MVWLSYGNFRENREALACVMKVLGFYIGGHDSNFSMVSDDGKVLYFKAERLVQSKHKKGNLEWILQICGEMNFVPDIVCYSDGNRNNLGICEEGVLFQQVKSIGDFFDVETYCIDHHYAHVLSCWPVSDACKDSAWGICIDGRGDHQIKCSVIRSPFDLEKAELVYGSVEKSYCLMFNQLGGMMGLAGGELDYAGKIMGAHAYGNVDWEFIGECLDRKYLEKPGLILQKAFKGVMADELCSAGDQMFYDWLASVHMVIGRHIDHLFEQFCGADDRIIYSGGGAQNAVYNESLQSRYRNLLIPPHCYDGGISLGCVKLVSLLKNFDIKIEHFPFSQDTEDLGYASPGTIRRVSDLLCADKIVGWCQGKGEVGPRALGHRSLLMNPSLANGKDILNSRVKKREFWRPYAASILEQNAEEITGDSRKCPYMLHAVKVRGQNRENLRAAVHKDGTCRLQTVGQDSALETYSSLLAQFEERTGIKGVLNTSLNFGGKPIIRTRSEAMALFADMDIDAICIGDELFVKGQ